MTVSVVSPANRVVYFQRNVSPHVYVKSFALHARVYRFFMLYLTNYQICDLQYEKKTYYVYLCGLDAYTLKCQSPQDWFVPTVPYRNNCLVWACNVATVSSVCCIVAIIPRMLCHKYSCSRSGKMILAWGSTLQ